MAGDNTRQVGGWCKKYERLSWVAVDTEDLLDIRGVHHIELPTLDSFSEDKQEKVLKEYRKFRRIKNLI